MAFYEKYGRTVCYRLLGDSKKPLVLMAHPLGMTQGVWDEMLPTLLGQFRVLTWDLPGHGASAAWPEEYDDITPEDLAQEALELASIAGAERFHFVGTSIGGVIGQQLMNRHSSSLLSVTLTNTGAVIGTRDAWNTRSANILELGMSAMAADIVPRWFGPSSKEEQPSLVEGWQVIMGRGDKRSYALLCEMLGSADFSEKLGDLDRPLLLIGGSEDVATPPDSLHRLAELTGSSSVVILENIGHVPSVECPEQLGKMLIERLA